jgi:hypothetical protein
MPPTADDKGDMMDICKNREGAWVVSALLNDGDWGGAYYHSHQYYGYTKREAVQMYREQFASRFDESEMEVLV